MAFHKVKIDDRAFRITIPKEISEVLKWLEESKSETCLAIVSRRGCLQLKPTCSHVDYIEKIRQIKEFNTHQSLNPLEIDAEEFDGFWLADAYQDVVIDSHGRIALPKIFRGGIFRDDSTTGNYVSIGAISGFLEIWDYGTWLEFIQSQTRNRTELINDAHTMIEAGDLSHD